MFVQLRILPLIAIVKKALKGLKYNSIKSLVLLFVVGISLSLAISACTGTNSANSTGSQTNSSPIVVRIGYQKSATLLNALKNQGNLEKTFSASGGSVQWTEFPAGPQMLEALNVGSIDFGYTGETPPIFAQAAGAPLVYVAYEKLGPAAEAILIPKNSTLKSVADLKGKKVALNKGSNVHYLLVKALEAVGLQYTDIKTVFLPPADARAAFEQGSVDAWVIWDPFLAAAETATGGRILADGKGLVENNGFFLAAQNFVNNHEKELKVVLDELQKVNDWAKNNPSKVAEFLSPQLGIDVPTLEMAEKRRDYGVQPISDGVLTNQQEIADTFSRLKLIPKSISIKEVVWKSK